jgi:hypothetical protein
MLYQTVEVGTRLGTAHRIGEEPVATYGHYAVILLISGKKLKSTIPGIHFTADAYELTTANDVRVVASCTSRSSPAS